MGSKWKTTFLELDRCQELLFKPLCCSFLNLPHEKNNFESITNTPVDSLAPVDLIFQGANCFKVKVLSTS